MWAFACNRCSLEILSKHVAFRPLGIVVTTFVFVIGKLYKVGDDDDDARLAV